MLCSAPSNPSLAISINPGSFASDFGFTMYRSALSEVDDLDAICRYQPSEGAEHGIEACSCDI
jgi:hypothetical protein